ncbi:hypothetical protein TKK_0003080 [Trichogramma kaykai]
MLKILALNCRNRLTAKLRCALADESARVFGAFEFLELPFLFCFSFRAATLFLELWKNYSAEITHRWDLTSLDVHEEHPRPKYLARLAHVKKKSVNFVTNTVEPRVPFWRVRLPVTILSCSVVLLLGMRSPSNKTSIKSPGFKIPFDGVCIPWACSNEKIKFMTALVDSDQP